ncbi:recombination protein U [Mesoplasma florum L1]|uniref:Holliday junction resolvase RecU n=2 Tax=Mesoplasma florum TaxID=2151 RepID=Q6F1R3_MESFL|nr:Holliday junction resolvase RecU [Mesoplasma florum]AAT75560.1 recombination protein U [Mesoplasma florum L1]AGY41276.1 RecU Holliday junction resolvase [Mesoplasma florum W37]ATI73159.1 Holliday junction resolvase RecU [Mesoplasma florum]ATI73846.1 Holliday junction resolvase RecU [Mesoplasma florum]AVN58813.1 Holliday junction resolvase RecU [Mesoplasma florum]
MNPIKNQGMFLETLLNITHQKYIDNNDCVVSKIPTNIIPITTKNNQITSAKFKDSLNCDYIGAYKGTYFEFEAKETYKDYFDFHLIRKNQNEKLKLVLNNKGIAFIIVYFGNYEEFFLVNYLTLINWVNKNKKTIPYEWFLDNAYQVYLDNEFKLNYLPKLNFLIS